MKRLSLAAGMVGLVLVTVLIAHEGYRAVVAALAAAGAGLLWLVPYRILPLALDAWAWRKLLAPGDPERRAAWPYLLWVATVREATNRLLPVANIGGEILGVRLVIARGVAGPAAAASVVVEVLLTTINGYLFAALGLALLVGLAARTPLTNALLWGLLAGLPVPALFALALRYGNLFERISRLALALLGDSGPLRSLIGHSANLDNEIKATVQRRGVLASALAWQFAGIVAGSFETWLALRLLGHPVGIAAAVTLESLNATVRNFAFFVPGTLGVQEIGLVLFGQLVGIDGHIAIALSLAKRMRELLFGVPALLSWQWLEGVRLRAGRPADAKMARGSSPHNHPT